MLFWIGAILLVLSLLFFIGAFSWSKDTFKEKGFKGAIGAFFTSIGVALALFFVGSFLTITSSTTEIENVEVATEVVNPAQDSSGPTEEEKQAHKERVEKAKAAAIARVKADKTEKAEQLEAKKAEAQVLVDKHGGIIDLNGDFLLLHPGGRYGIDAQLTIGVTLFNVSDKINLIYKHFSGDEDAWPVEGLECDEAILATCDTGAGHSNHIVFKADNTYKHVGGKIDYDRDGFITEISYIISDVDDLHEVADMVGSIISTFIRNAEPGRLNRIYERTFKEFVLSGGSKRVNQGDLIISIEAGPQKNSAVFSVRKKPLNL